MHHLSVGDCVLGAVSLEQLANGQVTADVEETHPTIGLHSHSDLVADQHLYEHHHLARRDRQHPFLHDVFILFNKFLGGLFDHLYVRTVEACSLGEELSGILSDGADHRDMLPGEAVGRRSSADLAHTGAIHDGVVRGRTLFLQII